ncbi:hypothetical protein GCM10025859_08910 [Alicyclobacillus fastidiosus]|nr:hypothetical protein GCM10025859_08910 [Alicyclobacillus fastidiosus]
MEIEEYKIIQSIPGIGGKIAATIISEHGEIDRFSWVSSIVRLAKLGTTWGKKPITRYKLMASKYATRDLPGLKIRKLENVHLRVHV